LSNEIFGFIFRALVYGQLFFWWWLYDQDWLNQKVSEHGIVLLLEVGLGGFAFFVAWNHWGVSQYTPVILIQYCLFYYLAWSIYKNKFAWVQALSVMGLTVFLNSYYWESVLHIHEFKMIWGFTPNMILQMVHLLPALFFIKRFKFNKNQALNDLTWGFFISFIVAFVTLRYLSWRAFSPIIPLVYRGTIKAVLYAINRLACLAVLIKVIFEAEQR